MNELILGLGLLVLATLATMFYVFRSKTPKLSMDRRRMPGMTKAIRPSQITKLTGITTEAISEFLETRGWAKKVASALDLAGMRVSPADFLVLVAAGGAVAGMFGLVLGGPPVAILFILASPAVAWALVRIKTSRRQSKFADQLDGTLGLFAGSLRAGHSMLKAVDAVAKESQSPTSEELAQVVAKTRLGVPLDEAMTVTAARMQSEDTAWVAQAIAIQREVGGDLSEILDRVSKTIRERNQIKRHVAALSAEGKMSAYILMALPPVIIFALLFVNPGYVTTLFTTGIYGFGVLALGLVMFVIGGLWMRKIVVFKF